MKRLTFLASAWLVLIPGLYASHTFRIPHLAGNGWNTVVTAYNQDGASATVVFRQWTDRGAALAELPTTVPAHGQFSWNEKHFLPEGIAALTTEAEKIRVKLTYQYGESSSMCEFFVTPDDLGTKWLMPNSHRNTFAWFGIAAANYSAATVGISASALKSGVEISRASFSLLPDRKVAALSEDLWGLGCREIDAVLISSDAPITAPISISGKGDQSRHVFFSATKVESSAGERRFYLPHVASEPWNTEIVVYNAGSEPASFSLHQYDDLGIETRTIAQVMPPLSQVTLSTQSGQLAEGGSGLLTGRGALAAKLSYRYGDSESISEFLVNGVVSRAWLLPNTDQPWQAWSGLAVQNPNSGPTDLLIRAYRTGSEVRTASVTIGARQKWAAVLQQSMSLDPREFDQITIETNQPVAMPLAISGNHAQDRHCSLSGQALATPAAPKKWTYLFYSDAEFANGYNPTRDFAQEAYSGSNLDVLVLEDTVTTPTTLYHVGPGYSLHTLEPPQEKNMGESKTLYDFIMKAKNDYPAERYILAFYDHGSGWQGCCMDQTSGDPGLTMNEIKSAVSSAGGVDLVLFTAPCLMGALESVYQLRDWTDVYVGSENLSGYIGWFGTIRFIRETLESNPEISNKDLGREIVDSIARFIPVNESRFRSSYSSAYTMSAIDVKAIPALAADLDVLAAALLEGYFDDLRMSASTGSVQNYSGHFSVDIHDLLDKYKASEVNPGILALISNAQQSLNASILAEYHGYENPGSHGLTVYFPLPSNLQYRYEYGDPQYGLDFSSDTRWDELVRLYKKVS